MRLVEQEIARAPQDLDVRAWRAWVFAWWGKLPEAEKEYLAILKVSRTDPDNWMGPANVYLGEGKIREAQKAIDAAEELDPRRPDIHAARARVLQAAAQRNEARSEFQSAPRLDPGSAEARDGLISVRHGAQHELRFGQDNDLLSYSPGGDYLQTLQRLERCGAARELLFLRAFSLPAVADDLAATRTVAIFTGRPSVESRET